MTPAANSNTDISQVINTSSFSKQSEAMDNDQNFDDTTTSSLRMTLYHVILTSC